MKVYGDIKVYGFCQITYAKNLTLIDTFFNFMEFQVTDEVSIQKARIYDE